MNKKIFLLVFYFGLINIGFGDRNSEGPKLMSIIPDGALVLFNSSDKNSWEKFTNKTTDFLEENQTGTDRSLNVVFCSYDRKPPPGTFCKVSLNEFYHCSQAQNYGYPRAKPCLFFHLEKLLHWEPEVYRSIENLPTNMPIVLQKLIEHQSRIVPTRMDMVWFYCEGLDPVDQENLYSTSYYPRFGFPTYYFPFENIQGYESPFVAVEFNITRGIIVSIVCKTWMANMDHQSSFHFELLID